MDHPKDGTVTTAACPSQVKRIVLAVNRESRGWALVVVGVVGVWVSG